MYQVLQNFSVIILGRKTELYNMLVGTRSPSMHPTVAICIMGLGLMLLLKRRYLLVEERISVQLVTHACPTEHLGTTAGEPKRLFLQMPQTLCLSKAFPQTAPAGKCLIYFVLLSVFKRSDLSTKNPSILEEILLCCALLILCLPSKLQSRWMHCKVISSTNTTRSRLA
ncbi:hypothetical protein KSP39_PZI014927 [Platanthera zijinensis]|uniref:Uncharacterized protein n=1 Tax=Platanthera zijinensis TaxID=2320716 RepID=A0AAP0BA99_9ASPA